jgi:type III pantothenate kinase
VNPVGIERILSEWPVADLPRPGVIRDASQLPLEVRLDQPNRVGIDRLLNGVAVNRLRRAGVPAIVVDSGTATTVDLISADGAFLGGAILPGLELFARSLHAYTALLPLVPVDELTNPGLPALGRDTRAALCSGLLYGQVGAIREVIARLSADLATPSEVYITGGCGELLVSHLGPAVRLEQELPLRGLAVVARNLSP